MTTTSKVNRQQRHNIDQALIELNTLNATDGPLDQVVVYRTAMKLAHLVAPDADANELTRHESVRGIAGSPALKPEYGSDCWSLKCPMCDWFAFGGTD